ncbi:Tkp5 protein [Vanderwaltozyma polyspora DSM 70294]|uniref:Tkp5 protein n=1 Tax=Vanderwaltozyma polyspora (strain ATCC 22028 / DSM 70294 / BCRC 21397 / CBS 2163 / NBRC 10782 / NRRL Y-8283 / UCD 57-17) TaxID=436907 RepID=A7TSE7_VANPO|nr:Tkp5 protein [Vanderwaltozyma polyspora DSM 70294]EDO14809.1 Tkp5 protein [Vanderwaltozyma polyspora DSM 70294]
MDLHEADNSTFSVSHLYQEVMSPFALSDVAIPIKLSGVGKFHSWLRLLKQHVDVNNLIWREYVETGDVHSVTQEFNLSTDVVDRIISILDSALRRLIFLSINTEIRKKAIGFLELQFRTHDSLHLLVYLKNLYCTEHINDLLLLYYEINTFSSKSIEDRIIWTKEFARSMFDLDQLDVEFPDPNIRTAVTEYYSNVEVWLALEAKPANQHLIRIIRCYP